MGKGFVPMSMPPAAQGGNAHPQHAAAVGPARVSSGFLATILQPTPGQELDGRYGGPPKYVPDQQIPALGRTGTEGGPPKLLEPSPTTHNRMDVRQSPGFVNPRKRAIPSSPTAILNEFLASGGAAKIEDLELIIQPPGAPRLFAEAERRVKTPRTEATAFTEVNNRRKRSAQCSQQYRNRKKTEEEDMKHRMELHRRQLQGVLAWLSLALEENTQDRMKLHLWRPERRVAACLRDDAGGRRR